MLKNFCTRVMVMLHIQGVCLVLTAFGAILIPAARGAAEDNLLLDLDTFPEGVPNTTAWALVYTYPLAIFASWAGGVLRNVSVNTIFHQRTLATPDDPGVIKPNIDTLYSRVVLDLSTKDVVLTVPNITDRYYNFPIYDAYGNGVAEIGIVNGNKPGNYLIQRAEDSATQPGFSNHTTYANASYQGIVMLPTTYGTMLIRILLLRNTTEDLDTVHRYQNASGLREIPRRIPTWKSSSPPTLLETAFNDTLLGIKTPQQQLEFAARVIDYNQPENYTDRSRVAGILARAGLYDGHYHSQAEVNLTQAAVIANSSITSFVESPRNKRLQGNGWELQTPENQGNYGTRYASAAYVALTGYQQLTAHQTLYPGYDSLGFTSFFTLPENGSLLVTFSGKPKLKKFGFWSLSVYGSDQYLIRNPINRYSISDRSTSLCYRDNDQFVYEPNATDNNDGVFDILVQRADTAPPSNWTGNWLPADENFSWILRWYVPEDAMTNGTYTYPVLKNISAITA